MKNIHIEHPSGNEKSSYLLPYILVTSLFFLWGFAHSILDILNKHFQDSLHISKTESALVQTMVYGAYFLMAIPAGKIIERFGYRWGVLTGLILYGVGALLFIPGGALLSFLFVGVIVNNYLLGLLSFSVCSVLLLGRGPHPVSGPS